MGRYVLRRLGQSIFTILGILLLTFVLFNLIRGDVSAQYVNPKAGKEQRQAFLEKHNLHLPLLYNTASQGRFWTKAFYQTQFFHHTYNCLTFQGRSFRTNQTLQEIIVHRARFSLAISVPALALGWLTAMIISCVVAYFRGTWIDHLGVFLSVLGMCVPYLAYMILGQWIMFEIHPPSAWGLGSPANVYVPVAIAVIAGLGGSVRFYRTIILNEVHQDYVRTARAKGAGLTAILFKHVLKNCMLPILTNLVLAIPFLILGSLLLERFFGVPGLGDLMISSITDRDVPIITALTFLTALIYVVGLLVTDVLYAVFDPRIRLR
jgi:peptide/nickel transport system permease protein